jgi:hypothetical protein
VRLTGTGPQNDDNPKDFHRAYSLMACGSPPYSAGAPAMRPARA